MTTHHRARTAAVAGLAAALGAAGVATATTAGAAAPRPRATTGCPAGELPAVVQGNPAVRAGATQAFYVFHDARGFHVRVTQPAHSRTVFSGVLTSAVPIGALHRVKLERADRVVVSRDRRSIAFRFTNFGYVDGFDLDGRCTPSLGFRLLLNGKAAPTSSVDLGRTKAHPTSNPFRVERTRPVTATPTPTPTASATASPTATPSA